MTKNKAKVVNGSVSVGDLVIGIPDTDYAAMIGKVVNIKNYKQKDYSEVFVNFKVFTPPFNKIKLVIEYYIDLFDLTHLPSFKELPIGKVPMKPKDLIKITELNDDELDKILWEYDEAIEFCESVLKGMTIHEAIVTLPSDDD